MYNDTSSHCVDPSKHCVDTLMITPENGLERKSYIMVLKCIFLYVIRMYFYIMVTRRCKQFSDWLTLNVNNSGMGSLLSYVTCV